MRHREPVLEPPVLSRLSKSHRRVSQNSDGVIPNKGWKGNGTSVSTKNRQSVPCSRQKTTFVLQPPQICVCMSCDVCCRVWMRRSEELVTSAALGMASCSCTSVLMKAIEDKTSLQKGKLKRWESANIYFFLLSGFLTSGSEWDIPVRFGLFAGGSSHALCSILHKGSSPGEDEKTTGHWIIRKKKKFELLKAMENLFSVLHVEFTSKSLWGHCRQPLPLSLEWLVRLATVVLVVQLFLKGLGRDLLSAQSICGTATLKAGPHKIQKSGSDWRKGSAVDVWVHLFVFTLQWWSLSGVWLLGRCCCYGISVNIDAFVIVRCDQRF